MVHNSLEIYISNLLTVLNVYTTKRPVRFISPFPKRHKPKQKFVLFHWRHVDVSNPILSYFHDVAVFLCDCPCVMNRDSSTFIAVS